MVWITQLPPHAIPNSLNFKPLLPLSLLKKEKRNKLVVFFFFSLFFLWSLFFENLFSFFSFNFKVGVLSSFSPSCLSCFVSGNNKGKQKKNKKKTKKKLAHFFSELNLCCWKKRFEKTKQQEETYEKGSLLLKIK